MDLCSGVRICHCPMGAARYAAVVSVVCNSNMQPRKCCLGRHCTDLKGIISHRGKADKPLTRRRVREKGKHMNRYMIVIPAKNRSFLLKCDEGDGMKPETLQKLVSGYVETVPAALDATWAREEADRLVLLVDEEGRLKCKAANQRATNIAPADVTRNGMQPLAGAAVLALQRGDKLMGFSKHVAEDILKEWL